VSREAGELRQRSDEALAAELQEAHQSLFNLRFRAVTGQQADNSQIRKTRRRIALIKTLVREREVPAADE
jgi:large subunit ribosomal protein L29